MLAIIREAEDEARAKGLLKGKDKAARKPRSPATRRIPTWVRWLLTVETLLLVAFLWGYFTDDSVLVPMRVDAHAASAAAASAPASHPQPVYYKDGVVVYPAEIEMQSKRRH